MSFTRLGPSLLLVLTGAVLAYLLPFVVFVAPVAQPAAGGLAQKIFYFHVPAAYAMYLGGTVCFAASAAYLWRESDRSDAVAAAGAEVAVLFGALVLTSGPLWAKKAWGVYWTWDPRLTTALLSWAIYVAMVVVRRYAGEGQAERKLGAALGVLGWFNLWLIHLSVQLWGGNHPTVIGSGGGGLRHPAMTHALLVGFLVMTLLAVALVWLRSRVHLLTARLQQLEQDAAQVGLLGEE